MQRTNVIVLDNNYESFEYMMLKSNRFKANFALSSAANDVFSWEQYFKKQLVTLSKKALPYSYKHGKSLPVCFYTLCKNCANQQHCKKKSESQESVLKDYYIGTKFEYLITLLGR